MQWNAGASRVTRPVDIHFSFHDTASGFGACRRREEWFEVGMYGQDAVSQQGLLGEGSTLEEGAGGSVGGGLYRLFVLAVAVWEGASCKMVLCCDGQRRPRARMVSTRKPFGEQSHPSRRTGCIKRSAHSRLASTLDEGGATQGQAQLARSHGRRLSMAPATGVCSWQAPSLPGPAIGCALTSVVPRTPTEHLDKL